MMGRSRCCRSTWSSRLHDGAKSLLQEHLEQRQRNRAIEMVEKPLLHVKHLRIERLPAVATEAAPAEQKSAVSTAELAVLDAKAKQDAANIQQLWEEEDPMDVQDEDDDNDKDEEYGVSLSEWSLQ
jgi:hypothetical protein